MFPSLKWGLKSTSSAVVKSKCDEGDVLSK